MTAQMLRPSQVFWANSLGAYCDPMSCVQEYLHSCGMIHGDLKVITFLLRAHTSYRLWCIHTTFADLCVRDAGR